MMVSVQLIGGLGNQLFQIAACIAYAKRNNIDFHIPAQVANVHSDQPYFTDLQNPRWAEMGFQQHYDEPYFHYNPIPDAHTLIQNNSLVLRGYFQSYKYFEGQWQQLQALPQNIFKSPQKTIEAVAIHVRRGDYLKYPTKHPVLDDQYLRTSILKMLGFGQHEFCFFSDDIEWCRQFVLSLPVYHGVEFAYSEGATPQEDLMHMASHQHQIMSNSTFAWWGAYLNPFAGKIVIYPKKWFGPDYANNNTKDLCPPNWIKM